MIQYICLEKNCRRKGDTLLFIDEIQNSPQAVMQMRYFYEELPDLFVIGAEPLLEISMDKRHVNFPVGRVEYRYLFPMTFEEFLQALGETQALDAFHTIPVPRYAEQKLMELFRLYTFVGGMPEAVVRYAETKDLSQLSPVYESLLTAYKDDVSKYAKGGHETDIIRHVIESTPAEVGNRIAFEHFGNSGYKSKEVGNALRTLERAMLLYLRYPVTGYALPLVPNLRRRPRLQFIDTGLLGYALGGQAAYFTEESLDALYAGKLAEQLVAQELMARSNTICEKPLFWIREEKQSNAEVDFLTVNKGKVYPVEVKSGKNGTLRSLHEFINASGNSLAVRLYSGTFSVEEARTPVTSSNAARPYRLLNLPLFLASQVNSYIEAYSK
ncbi:MAG: ATP-binding protein [Spirochaetia bacterium]|nr:ATP-binding protein [Spirochaetia bacterium]